MAPELSSCKLIQGCESKTLITGVWQKKNPPKGSVFYGLWLRPPGFSEDCVCCSAPFDSSVSHSPNINLHGL